MNRRRYTPNREKTAKEWIPKTKVGKLVKSGEIASIEDIYEKNLAILEPEIIDALVPTIEEDVLAIKTVQRTTDSGRRGSFMITAVVGNKDGYVGIGVGKGNEVRPTIERAVRDAKKNIIHVRRGCGSWECGCGETHSLPFKIRGRYASVNVELFPAPKGTGVAAGRTARRVLELAGVKDAWSHTSGDTRTAVNFARATLAALKKTRSTKLLKDAEKV